MKQNELRQTKSATCYLLVQHLKVATDNAPRMMQFFNFETTTVLTQLHEKHDH